MMVVVWYLFHLKDPFGIATDKIGKYLHFFSTCETDQQAQKVLMKCFLCFKQWCKFVIGATLCTLQSDSSYELFILDKMICLNDDNGLMLRDAESVRFVVNYMCASPG